MIIEDQDTYYLLTKFDSQSNKYAGNFASLLRWHSNESINTDKIINFLKTRGLIKQQIDSTTSKPNIEITENGYKFIRKYANKKQRDAFNEWAIFLKNIGWLITFIISIVCNIVTLLKLFRVF